MLLQAQIAMPDTRPPMSPDRRGEQRTETSFFAVELRSSQTGTPELYYRLVRDISANGFSFDDPFPLERPGDEIEMEFPLPGAAAPIHVRGQVVYARPDRGVGVRILDVDQRAYERLMAVPPPARA